MAELRTAFAFLTRLPISAADAAPGNLGRALRHAPLVGAVVGAGGAAVFSLGAIVGLGPYPSALLAVAGTILLSGALHEDGLADVADGFGGGWSRARKLEIMGDSRIGTYGSLALTLSILLRVALIAALQTPERVLAAMIVTGALSRAVMYGAMRILPNAKDDGIGHSAGRPQTDGLASCAAATLIICVVALPIGLAGTAILGAAGGGGIMALTAYRQIGGGTGDVFGAVQQISEIAALSVLVIILTS